MKKFFIILGVLFLIALLVTILTGNLTWKDIKHKSVTIKESFLKTSENISETAGKVKDFIAEKIQQIKDKRRKSP